MRTQKFVQVESIVAKYKNLAKDKFPKKATPNSPLFDDAYFAPTYGPQLLYHFYELAAKGMKAPEVNIYRGDQSEPYQEGLLSQNEERFLTENFDILLDYLLDNEYGFEVHFDSPNGWSSLVSYLLSKKEGCKVFIPSSDKGKEMIGLQNCSFTIGNEYDYAVIRTLFTNNSVNRYSCENDKEEQYWSNLERESFDVFIGDLCGLVKPENVSLYLKASYDLVRDGGELLIALPRIVLISDDTLDFRKKIANKQELAEAITLTGETVLLHIIKRKQTSFVMVDATAFSHGNGLFSNKLDLDSFLSMVSNANQPELENKYCVRLDYSQFNENLYLPSYYLKRIEGDSLSTLADVIDNSLGTDMCTAGEKVVTINNLSHVFSNGEITLNELKDVDLSRHRAYKKVTGPCVIFTMSEKETAVGYVKEEYTVLVPHYMYVLKPKNIHDTLFIAANILSIPVKEQICGLTIGKDSKKLFAYLYEGWENYITIPHLNEEEKEDFVHLVTRSDWNEQEELVQRKSIRYKQTVRMRKHALSQNISSFDSLFRTLVGCFKDQGEKLKGKDKISPISDLTVTDTFHNLLEKLDVISERVDHIAETQDWGECEAIEPQQFLEEYENTHKEVNFKFSHSWEDWDKNSFEEDIKDPKTGELFFHAGESLYAAWFPKAALSQVLENIVSNAKEHGFVDPTRNDYRIHFKWTTDGLNLILEISNNGVPLSSEMSTDKVLMYGYSSSLNSNGHGGIGGGQIFEIMQEFGGNVEVVSTPANKYTVKYVLSLPLASIY